MFRFFSRLTISLLVSVPALAVDLARVYIGAPDDVTTLQRSQATAVLRVSDGYLVLVEAPERARLQSQGIQLELITTDVDPERLAVDLRLDDYNRGRHQLLFEEERLRVYQLAPDFDLDSEQPPTLKLLSTAGLPIIYRAKVKTTAVPPQRDPVLRELVENVNQDSLYSYVMQLQSLYRRVAGTPQIYQARDLIKQRFLDFGYDSVYLNGFIADVSGGSAPCYNVVAVKPGSIYSQFHVIVGAHYDGVPGSPAQMITPREQPACLR